MARRLSTSTNPFVFDRPLSPEDAVDREDELAVLAERTRDGVNTRLSSPRDYGKTSLLQRAIADARAAEAGAVLVEHSTESALPVRWPLGSGRAYEALPSRTVAFRVEQSAQAWRLDRGSERVSGAPAWRSEPAKPANGRCLMSTLDLPGSRTARENRPAGPGRLRRVPGRSRDAAGCAHSQRDSASPGAGVTYVFSGLAPGHDGSSPLRGSEAPLLRSGCAARAGVSAARRTRRVHRGSLRAGQDVEAGKGPRLAARSGGRPSAAGDALRISPLAPYGGRRRSRGRPPGLLDAYEEAWGYLQGDFEATWDSLSVVEAGVVDAVAAGVQGLTGRAGRESSDCPLAPRPMKRPSASSGRECSCARAAAAKPS